MEPPMPSPEHQRLQELAGTWKGTEKMYPSSWDSKGGEAHGITRGRVALDGFALVVDYEQWRDGKCTFEGHGVYTWDAGANEVVLHWFDNMGQGREEFRGNWEGNRLRLESKNPMGFARLTYDRSEKGKLSSSMEMSQDGESWSTLFEGSYELES